MIEIDVSIDKTSPEYQQTSYDQQGLVDIHNLETLRQKGKLPENADYIWSGAIVNSRYQLRISARWSNEGTLREDSVDFMYFEEDGVHALYPLDQNPESEDDYIRYDLSDDEYELVLDMFKYVVQEIAITN